MPNADLDVPESCGHRSRHGRTFKLQASSLGAFRPQGSLLYCKHLRMDTSRLRWRQAKVFVQRCMGAIRVAVWWNQQVVQPKGAVAGCVGAINSFAGDHCGQRKAFGSHLASQLDSCLISP